ncbi:MAG: fluoride efflux transporter FluC [Acidimicrobiales bacterium]
MTATLALAVLVAGALGALARQLLNDAIAHRVRADFPFGILTINLLGSFALGLLSGLAAYHGLSADVLVVLGAGICGGFTTWSTSIWETLQLLRLRLYTQAALHSMGGLALGVGVAAAGLGLAAIA